MLLARAQHILAKKHLSLNIYTISVKYIIDVVSITVWFSLTIILPRKKFDSKISALYRYSIGLSRADFTYNST